MPKPRSSKDRPDANLPASPAMSYLNNAFFVLVGVAVAVGAAILAYTRL